MCQGPLACQDGGRRGEVLGHPIVEVFALDGVLMLVEPVDCIPPFIGRHNVVGLADLAGDVILGPGASVISSVQTTLAGATGWEDAARQVQLHQLVLDLDAPQSPPLTRSSRARQSSGSRCSGLTALAQTRWCLAQT